MIKTVSSLFSQFSSSNLLILLSSYIVLIYRSVCLFSPVFSVILSCKLRSSELVLFFFLLALRSNQASGHVIWLFLLRLSSDYSAFCHDQNCFFSLLAVFFIQSLNSSFLLHCSYLPISLPLFPRFQCYSILQTSFFRTCSLFFSSCSSLKSSFWTCYLTLPSAWYSFSLSVFSI